MLTPTRARDRRRAIVRSASSVASSSGAPSTARRDWRSAAGAGRRAAARSRRGRVAYAAASGWATPSTWGQGDVGAGVELGDDEAHEGRVQERHVGRRHIRRVGARSAAADSPVATPWTGPRPSCGSSTSRTPRGSSGSDCPGAMTTMIGPDSARASTPQARCTSVERCHSSPAFGVPIRDERPPASTIPADVHVSERRWSAAPSRRSDDADDVRADPVARAARRRPRAARRGGPARPWRPGRRAGSSRRGPARSSR